MPNQLIENMTARCAGIKEARSNSWVTEREDDWSAFVGWPSRLLHPATKRTARKAVPQDFLRLGEVLPWSCVVVLITNSY
jgi:hypothetical protein